MKEGWEGRSDTDKVIEEYMELIEEESSRHSSQRERPWAKRMCPQDESAPKGAPVKIKRAPVTA